MEIPKRDGHLKYLSKIFVIGLLTPVIVSHHFEKGYNLLNKFDTVMMRSPFSPEKRFDLLLRERSRLLRLTTPHNKIPKHSYREFGFAD
jgi:hypothetical protein